MREDVIDLTLGRQVNVTIAPTDFRLTTPRSGEDARWAISGKYSVLPSAALV